MKRIIGAAALALLVLAPTASLGASFTVKTTNNDTFNPTPKTIHKGDKIVWKNPSSNLHTITAYSNNWSKNTNLAPDQQTSKRFGKRGTFKYYCTEHGHVTNSGVCHGMCGKIKVIRN